jgi:flavin-dependent dehydrogenase
MTFYGPSMRTGLRQHVPKEKLEIKMERRDIYAHFIKHALECGVKIEYEHKVLGPIILGNRVVGIKTDKGDIYGDLIIDSCGMNSPVRTNLPEEFGIEKEVARNEKITIYRAFFNKACDDAVEAKFKVMLFAGGELGVNWIASEEDHTDLLMGRFEDFTNEDVERFSTYLRETNPRLGTEIIRGGQFVEIPVRQPLSVMVADGYAAIGDSAFMTVPLIGSGIANCLKASRVLANAVIADKNQVFTAETLWKYQQGYYKELGAGLAPLACGKLLLLSLTPEEVDYVMDNGILTEDLMTIGADFTGLGSVNIDPRALINQAKQVCQDPELLKKIIACGVRMGKAVAACAMMPKKYNAKRIRSWAKVYEFVYK